MDEPLLSEVSEMTIQTIKTAVLKFAKDGAGAGDARGADRLWPALARVPRL